MQIQCPSCKNDNLSMIEKLYEVPVKNLIVKIMFYCSVCSKTFSVNKDD